MAVLETILGRVVYARVGLTPPAIERMASAFEHEDLEQAVRFKAGI